MRCTREWILSSNTDNSKSLIDRLLEIRGIVSEDAKQEFLHPLEITLMHPNAFVDMPKAVDRIVKALDEKEKILKTFIIADNKYLATPSPDSSFSASLLYAMISFENRKISDSSGCSGCSSCGGCGGGCGGCGD